MSTRIEKRLYSSVSANSSEELDYVIPNGQTLELGSVGGNAGTSPDTVVHVIYDPGGGSEEVLFATHGDSNYKFFDKQIVGDGVKLIRIKIVNDQSVSDYIGCYWEGHLV